MNTVFTTYPTRSATPGTRPAAYPARGVAAPSARPNLQDDYERWYTEPTANNRMVLALCSGIDSEIGWALDRLCRLCNNERFILREIPGLTEALFEWPFWYVKDGAREFGAKSAMFALARDEERWIRHALESMFILRNSAINSPNAQELVGRRATQELILLSLHRLEPDSDYNVEFLLNTVDLLQAIASGSVLPPPDSHLFANPVPPLLKLAGTSTNRSLIYSSLVTLNLLFANPPNMVHLTPESPALEAAIRYLPLFKDKPLVDACLNFLYTHLSYTPMSKAFLLHRAFPATLRLLVLHLLSEQVEEPVVTEIPGPVYTVPAEVESLTDHELTPEELEYLLPLPEPQRCFKWMEMMFELDPESEVTQVDFWTLYRDVFTPYSLALGASDVIKNVTVLWPQAVAMVLPGPPQRFVVRGVTRRKNKRSVGEKYQCRWDRGECGDAKSTSSGELYEHILEQHINPHLEPEVHCTWATCSHRALSKALIRGHVLTHIPSMQPPPKHPMQDERVTLPSQGFPHPIPEPTKRPIPPPRSATITYRRPIADPPSSALTALLCIRVLFRASFASSDAAPHFDENHFGFPGTIEDDEEKDGSEEVSGATDSEQEGERRGRKAFVGVRYLLEGVRLRDEVLNGWITEMVDAGLTGAT